MFTHTHGPWRVVGGTEVRGGHFGGVIICDTSQFRVPHPDAQAFAAPDARLIAAAPALLEALQTLADAVDQFVPLANEWPELSAARAAIAQAMEGQSWV
jgi:GAF domain-containing protein